MVVPVRIVNMDAAWTNCIFCNEEILVSGAYVLPMYEGKVDWGSNVYFPVCVQCYEKHKED